MTLGIIIIFFASAFYYYKTKRNEGILLLFSSLVLTISNVFSSYVFPFWLLKNPEYKESVANVYAINFVISSIFAIALGVGFALLIRRTLHLEKTLKHPQQ